MAMTLSERITGKNKKYRICAALLAVMLAALLCLTGCMPEEPAAPETPAGPVSDEDVKEVAGGRIENGFVHDYCSLCGVDVEAPYEEGKITKLVCPACGHIMYRRYY